jgi:hypothetical protein
MSRPARCDDATALNGAAQLEQMSCRSGQSGLSPNANFPRTPSVCVCLERSQSPGIASLNPGLMSMRPIGLRVCTPEAC